jgi:membrane associated rhomboid family serine protease
VSAAVAHRARATQARVLTLGLAIASTSNILFTVTQGPITGSSAHFAIFVGSVVGVAAGAFVSRRGSPGNAPGTPTAPRVPSREASRAWRPWHPWLQAESSF